MLGVLSASTCSIPATRRLAPAAPTEIRFPQPVEARFVRLDVLGGQGEETRFGPVSLLAERPAATLSSIGAAQTIDGAPRGARQDGAPEPTGQRPLPAAAQAEAEPNDAPEQAQPIQVPGAVSGAIDRPDDVDRFRFEIRADQRGQWMAGFADAPPAAALAVIGRHASGEEVIRFDPGGRRRAREPFWLEGGAYDVTVSRPASKIVMVFDVSGSMADRIQALGAAARRYVGRRQPEEDLALIRFSDDVTLMQGFTRDAQALGAAFAPGLKLGAGTALYDALHRALGLLKDEPGRHAIVLVSDGGDTQSKVRYADLWAEMEQAEVGFYPIGVGHDLDVLLPGVGQSGRMMLDAWARATGGQAFLIAGPEEFDRVYDAVSARLRELPSYVLDLHPAEGRGRVSVALAAPSAPGGDLQAGKPAAAPRAPHPQYEIILDASGSMIERARDGQRKIDAAKAAVSAIVSGLPDDALVALRVYGHRLPDRPTARSCTDIELMAPMRAGNRDAILHAVGGVKPRGETPIGASLRLAAQDFVPTEGRRSILLVTDGDESCATKASDPDYPDRVVQDLRATGFDVTVSIVGLNVTEARERGRLQRLAAAGGGSYHDASGTAELVAAMRGAFSVPFRVFDPGGGVAASGTAGGPAVEVPVGEYCVEAPPQDKTCGVKVRAGEETRVTLAPVASAEGGVR